MSGGIEGESPRELTSQTNQPEETQHSQKSPAYNPTGEKEPERLRWYGTGYKPEQHNVTAIFNSFIRGFLGDEKEVGRMLKEGRITEEEALQKKKAASRRKQEAGLRVSLNSMVESGFITLGRLKTPFGGHF